MNRRIELNHQDIEVQVPDDVPLLWFLREEMGLTGTKFGCGKGLCGACTVHIDGLASRSCSISIGQVLGKKVLTIEGLSANGDHALQRQWQQHNVPQCGYCQSGQIMSAAALLSRTRNPTDREISTAMAGNICRCGTYQQILAAIKAAASENIPGKEP